jgi:hypothetical protein
MANTFQVNSLAELVAIRAAESAPYFTVGSKKYFKDQLVGKRNGQTYRFVIRDVGGAYEGLAADIANDKIDLTEREVSLAIRDFRVMVRTNAIESVTDVNWDPEIAQPNGQKLANKAVKAIMDSDFGKVGTCFVGQGFAPLSRASAHLASISNEELFGFCDPNVEAILTSNGQQFVPVSAPDMYSKGLLGKFHGAEYRSQRFFPSVKIDFNKTVTDAELNGGLILVDYTAGTSYDTIEVEMNDMLPDNLFVRKGTPIFIDGVYACDTVGDPTSMLHAFVLIEDATTTGSHGIVMKVPHVDMSGEGTRDIAKADGTNWTIADLESANAIVTLPEDGTYYMGIVRANGAFEFETLDRIEAAGAKYEKQNVEGLNIHQNELVDLEKMTNYTRWDMPTLAGTVEPRAVAMFLVK